MSGKEAYLELKFRPNVELISAVRRFVSECYDEVLADSDAVARVALATHELLENGVKYSIDGQTTLRLQVSNAADTRTVTIKVWNRASAEHIASLRELFAAMAQATDPFAYYQGVMRKNMKRTDGSGLGLARIWCEAEMKLT